MKESKPYNLPEDESWMVAEAVATRVPAEASVNSLRKDLTEAIFATDNEQLLYTCLIFLKNQEQQVIDVLEDWALFPDARGYVYWDYTHGKDIAGITIAPNKMVAFVKKDGQLHKYNFDAVRFSAIIKILEEVHG